MTYLHKKCTTTSTLHTFNGPLSVTTQVSQYQKGNNLDFTEARDSEWRGISWAVCKSAPRSRQTTTPAPHHSVFFTGRMPFLPPNQQRQSTEGTHKKCKSKYIFQVRYHYPHLGILPKNNIMYLYTPHTYITTLKDDLIKFNKISTKFQYGQCLLSVTGIVTISYNTSFKLLKLL